MCDVLVKKFVALYNQFIDIVLCVMYKHKFLFGGFGQDPHASRKVVESSGFVFLKVPGPGKSWKITFVLESPGNLSFRP